MNGGAEPIVDGDWVFLRPAAGAELGAFVGQVVLVAVSDRGPSQ